MTGKKGRGGAPLFNATVCLLHIINPPVKISLVVQLFLLFLPTLNDEESEVLENYEKEGLIEMLMDVLQPLSL